MPEVVLSTRSTSYRISREVAAGRLKKIGPRLYSSRVKDAPAKVIERNLWEVIGLLFPQAVISQRTAIELQPTPTNRSVFLTGRYRRTVKLPGVTVRMVRGPGAVEGDVKYGGALWLASPARAYLENLTPARRHQGAGRVLARHELEDRLERLLRVSGEQALNSLRDAARGVAPQLGLTAELGKLDEIVARLLGSRAGRLTGAAAIARAAGIPYDADRLRLFDALVRELRSWPVADRPLRAGGETFEPEAFYDAYFSNYIEGTEFDIAEAVGIVFENRIPDKRPADAHDILGTYRLLSDPEEMSHSAKTEADDPEAFLRLLQRRHRTILAGRPEVSPGEFKTETNRAGNTIFVTPELVRGTLQKGLERFRALGTPFARAAFIMFLVSEAHPFADGNGRLARVMMNAELIAGGQRRIIIPTVYRDDYLGALRALSRGGRAQVLPQLLDRAQLFTSRIDFGDVGTARLALERAGAFLDPSEGTLRIPE